MLTPEREAQIREYKDQCSTAHNMKQELLAEIDRLREENLGLNTSLIGQEHRLGSRVETMIQSRDAAFTVTRETLNLNSELRGKLSIAVEALELYSDADILSSGVIPNAAGIALSKIRSGT